MLRLRLRAMSSCHALGLLPRGLPWLHACLRLRQLPSSVSRQTDALLQPSALLLDVRPLLLLHSRPAWVLAWALRLTMLRRALLCAAALLLLSLEMRIWAGRVLLKLPG